MPCFTILFLFVCVLSWMPFPLGWQHSESLCRGKAGDGWGVPFLKMGMLLWAVLYWVFLPLSPWSCVLVLHMATTLLLSVKLYIMMCLLKKLFLPSNFHTIFCWLSLAAVVFMLPFIMPKDIVRFQFAWFCLLKHFLKAPWTSVKLAV